MVPAQQLRWVVFVPAVDTLAIHTAMPVLKALTAGSVLHSIVARYVCARHNRFILGHCITTTATHSLVDEFVSDGVR